MPLEFRKSFVAVDSAGVPHTLHLYTTGHVTQLPGGGSRCVADGTAFMDSAGNQLERIDKGQFRYPGTTTVLHAENEDS